MSKNVHIDKESFLKELEFFCKQAIENTNSGTREGSELELNKRIDKILETSGLVCKINFDHINNAGQQDIVFVRKDVLGKNYVNGEKPTSKQGIYIRFYYFYETKSFYLEFGYPKVECDAFDKMNRDECFGTEVADRKFRKSYSDFESCKDKIMADFLEFVAYYKGFEANDFIVRNRQVEIEMNAKANNQTDAITAAIVSDTMSIKSE